ncbi:hypothetical protein EJ03DRAFT_331513 [Teratosphaeria nubilosa]|uniref:YDG domain-containing protein n=1 Tax=Teratosphaeria nubilosa TaxID=161662 RepID=A0A6G1KWV2_9PEZI|nr:hypothetical protein EJ03DRAFT_331513 [Teratosphaeria nubilosa]
MAAKQSEEKESKPDLSTWCPPADHTLFGEGRALHGLAIRGGGLVRNTQLPDVPFQKHGHHGIELGKWFYNRKQMVVRGAHGEYVKGVSGNAYNGVFAVCAMLGSGYNDDKGEELTFPGPIPEPYTRCKAGDDSKGRYHKDYRPQTTALRTSYRAFKADPNRKDLKGSVRVFGEVTVYAKTTVFTYDGLYDVVDKDEEYFLGNDKYLHPSFKLQRRAGQAKTLAETKAMMPKPNELRPLLSAARDLMDEKTVSGSVRGWYELRPNEVEQKRIERSKARKAVDKEARESSVDDGMTGEGDEVKGESGDEEGALLEDDEDELDELE